jgi:AraC family transcriptional regulator, dual regulator of chb operon
MKTLNQNRNITSGWLSEALNRFDQEVFFTKGLEGLIEVCGYRSIEHISREMKKQIHMTPSEVVNEIRLAYAAKRIKETTDKIIDISFDVGYNSLSYFNRLFKKAYGITPLQYRIREK